MVEERIVEKIRKLLALAGNNPSSHERARAMEKAQDLLTAHNLSMSQVTATFAGEVRPIKIEIRDTEWSRPIVLAACKLYYCNLLISKDSPNGKTYFSILGTSENVAVATQIADWLVSSVTTESRADYPDEVARRSFRLGVGQQLLQRVEWRLEQERIKAAPTEDGEPCTALAVIEVRDKLQEKNDDYLEKQNIEDTQDSVEPGLIDPFAFIHGKQFGQSIGLERQIEADEPIKELL